MVSDEFITFPEFHLTELLDQVRLIDAALFNDFPELKAYLERFKELPAIEKYLKSDRFFEHPINNKVASFK